MVAALLGGEAARVPDDELKRILDLVRRRKEAAMNVLLEGAIDPPSSSS